MGGRREGETGRCGKCDGAGRLSWTRVADGACFACDGTGVVRVTLVDAERAETVAWDRALNRMAETLVGGGSVWGEAADLAERIHGAVAAGTVSREGVRQWVRSARVRDYSGVMGPRGRTVCREAVDAVCSAGFGASSRRAA